MNKRTVLWRKMSDKKFLVDVVEIKMCIEGLDNPIVVKKTVFEDEHGKYINFPYDFSSEPLQKVYLNDKELKWD